MKPPVAVQPDPERVVERKAPTKPSHNRQYTMPFDLIHPNKARSRSVHLDQVIANSSKEASPAPPPAIANRSSSLAHRENKRPVIAYRSMLVVEPPPEIAPLKAMGLEELHREVVPLSECQAPRSCIASRIHFFTTSVLFEVNKNFELTIAFSRSQRCPCHGSSPASYWQALLPCGPGCS